MLFNLPDKRNGVKSMIGTSVRQRVPVERITSYRLNIDIRKISKFTELVKPMFDKIKENARQIITLSKIRNTLLPKLMSGELRLKGIEEAI